MLMIPIKSIVIRKAGHDPQNNIMWIEADNGKKYEYENVNAELFNDFVEAESPIDFFMTNIKNKFKQKDK